MGDLTVPEPLPLSRHGNEGDTLQYSPNLARAAYGGVLAMILALILLASPGYFDLGLFFLVLGALLLAAGMIGAHRRGRK